MITPRRVEVSLYTAAVLVLAATAWARVSGPSEADTRRAADAGLDRLLAAERAHFAAGSRFAPFGSAGSELAVALPGVVMPEAADFAFDAYPDAGGGLFLRAITRPEAVAGRRVFPMVVSRAVAAPRVAEPTAGAR